MTITGKKLETVTIKGQAGGLLIRLHDEAPAPFAELVVELDERLRTGQQFFRQGKAMVDLGDRVLELTDLEALKNSLSRYEIELEAVISGTNATRALAKQLNLPVKLPTNHNTRPVLDLPEASPGGRKAQPFDSAECLFLRRTLRSGQRIQHHADLVVLGDLNPGSEVVAGGNVIVWGHVRGKIQAGLVVPAAIICALSLRPTQLAIGEVVAVGNNDSASDPELGPEMASVQDGVIVVDSWMPRRGRSRR